MPRPARRSDARAVIRNISVDYRCGWIAESNLGFR